jgi:hypothetical protein
MLFSNLFLECPAKEEQHALSEVGMSHDRDCGYGNIHQAWMVVVEKA